MLNKVYFAKCSLADYLPKFTLAKVSFYTVVQLHNIKLVPVLLIQYNTELYTDLMMKTYTYFDYIYQFKNNFFKH